MFSKKYWKAKLYTILSLDSHPGHIAASFAVGVFISFTPFIGLHALLAIAIAFLLRINKVACVTGSCINTPITVIPALGLSYQLGCFLRGRPADDLSFLGDMQWHDFGKHAKSLMLGSSVIGFFLGIIAYFACYYLVVRLRARDEAQAELDRGMAEVGEELK